jgi:hypothetical protein
MSLQQYSKESRHLAMIKKKEATGKSSKDKIPALDCWRFNTSGSIDAWTAGAVGTVTQCCNLSKDKNWGNKQNKTRREHQNGEINLYLGNERAMMSTVPM